MCIRAHVQEKALTTDSDNRESRLKSAMTSFRVSVSSSMCSTLKRIFSAVPRPKT